MEDTTLEPRTLEHQPDEGHGMDISTRFVNVPIHLALGKELAIVEEDGVLKQVARYRRGNSTYELK